MNKNVMLLDCTLRDGGFINNWNFGHGTINTIFNRLNDSGIDIIELGFIDARETESEERTIQPNSTAFAKVFDQSNSKAKKVVMIDYGTCELKDVLSKEQSIFDGIRVIFKKKDIIKALEFCKEIQNKGYFVCVQPVSVTTYSEVEMLELIRMVNEINPFVLSIVDTYGLMHREKLLKYFKLMDKNLDKKISIGFHSHNNFQLAYSNSIELLSVNTNRNVIIDGSCYGMGKGAGNANTELLALYLNEYCEKRYAVNSILEAIDTNILPFMQQYKWGYSLDYYLSASNDCHPKYVKYLISKKTLSIFEINEILNKLCEEKKLAFDESYIKKLYNEYQLKEIDDTCEIRKVRQYLGQRKILLLGPGKSVVNELERIKNFIENNNPIIISLNYVCNLIDTDIIFLSNKRRYMQLVDNRKKLTGKEKIIMTSNISEGLIKAEWKLNYEGLLGTDKQNDTSLSLALNLINKCGCKEIYLAGIDGFTKKIEENYIELGLSINLEDDMLLEKNLANQRALVECAAKVYFLTTTIYRI